MTTTTAAASAMAKISDSVSGHIQQSTNSGSEEMTEAETAMAINEVGDGNSDGDNNKLKAAAKETAVAVMVMAMATVMATATATVTVGSGGNMMTAVTAMATMRYSGIELQLLSTYAFLGSHAQDGSFWRICCCRRSSRWRPLHR